MSVHAKRRVRGVGCVRPAVTAAMLLDPTHPLSGTFVKFCGSNPPTKRQAAKFLAKFPQFRQIKSAS